MFRPLYCDILTNEFVAQFLDTDDNPNLDSNSILEKSDRRLIFNNNVDSLDELSQKLINYIVYLSQRNTNRTVLNTDFIEELIEKDFLDMAEDV